ncbi:gas vesicle protein GvpG [Streptomyces sp. NBC_00690]|uniref:gas vesicle protein GvpG n=1 Tax=Streptomyces sp. NBC_00690 TaxID=2975808 RepID=UPI002E2DD42D|nr:gas vesicle protein GvpG [Streptomyces sp. NBC_00690]
MGLISGILLLPLAPVRGVVWVAERFQDAAERELNDPAVLRAQLCELNRELDDGCISWEEFEAEEDRLLDRLHGCAEQAGPRRLTEGDNYG